MPDVGTCGEDVMSVLPLQESPMVGESVMGICHITSGGQRHRVPFESISLERRPYEVIPRRPIMPTRTYMSGNNDVDKATVLSER